MLELSSTPRLDRQDFRRKDKKTTFVARTQIKINSNQKVWCFGAKTKERLNMELEPRRSTRERKTRAVVESSESEEEVSKMRPVRAARPTTFQCEVCSRGIMCWLFARARHASRFFLKLITT
jgi:hypothetical protein